MVTKGRKDIKKPRQKKGYANKDIYLKLESVEKKIDFSHRTQIRIGLYAIGVAFVILGLSLWSDFLRFIGIVATQGSINPIFYIIIGIIALIFANIVSRPRQKVKNRQAVELTGQEIRKLEKSAAKAHGLLSLGLFRVSLLAHGGWLISLLALGTVFALSSIYLAFIHKWKRKEFLAIAANVQLEHVVWFLAFILLGTGLIETRVNWLAIPGLICIYVGSSIVIVGGGILIIRTLKEAKQMGTKGRLK